MKNQLKNIMISLASLSVLALPLLLSGCNTMEGAGTDIKEAGKALERSAENSKESCPRCPYCSHCHAR